MKMNSSEMKIDVNEEIVSVLDFKSNIDFVNVYNTYNNSKSMEIYLHLLSKIKNAVLVGDLDDLGYFDRLIDCIKGMKDKDVLRGYYENAHNPIRNTNLVILACKSNRIAIMEYLLNDESKILGNLSIGIGLDPIMPNDEDDEGHNAFYYAIESSNVELLNLFIHKWPLNLITKDIGYFDSHPDELEEILSKSFEELKIRNVLLSDEMQCFVENKLIDLRFFSLTELKIQKIKTRERINNIKQRIELVIENIYLLIKDYSNEVDDKFLFVAKFIAKNIHILKHQVKSTYNKLPWEEIEFCLVCFISSYTKQQEINLIICHFLFKERMLQHLDHFAKQLQVLRNSLDDKDINKLIKLPGLKREQVISDICNEYPHFSALYDDYIKVRDAYSLYQMNSYAQLALSIKHDEKIGRLVIFRALQVIGEHLKYTLVSPKLSKNTSDLLLLSAPPNTRTILIDLRNSLSHSESDSKMAFIRDNSDDRFIFNIQKDLEKVADVMTNLLDRKIVEMVCTLLKRIILSESLDDIKLIIQSISHIKLPKASIKTVTRGLDLIEDLFNELNMKINKKTDIDKSFLNKFNDIKYNSEIDSWRKKMNTCKIIIEFFSLCVALELNAIDSVEMDNLKDMAICILKEISPQTKYYFWILEKISKLVSEISSSFVNRTEEDNYNEIMNLLIRIYLLTDHEARNIKWIEELKEKLSLKTPKVLCSSEQDKGKSNCQLKDFENLKQFKLKLSTLEEILNSNGLRNDLFKSFPSYKNDRKLQVAIEMLVLDILSLVDSPMNSLTNNLLFLDENSPSLIGRCLRNYLAHGNALMDILLADISIAVFFNAQQLISKNVLESNKKIGKLVLNNPGQLKAKYLHHLDIIDTQQKMYIALEDGSLDELKHLLKKRADINSRNVNLWSSLHFSSKGTSLELLKTVLNKIYDVNTKDNKGQTALHVAARYGRMAFVTYLIEDAGMVVDEVDIHGKTPLHIAAQSGHKEVIDTLLKKKASTTAKDVCGYTPLYYSVQRMHLDSTEILLKNEVNVDVNVITPGGFTSLHTAAEHGCLPLVKMLVGKKAHINKKTEASHSTALHFATSAGHLEVVNFLIINGADVNSEDVNGYTALHKAAKNNKTMVVNSLLDYGAQTNVTDKIFNRTPLHLAAINGYNKIVEALLNNKANVNAADINGKTALHYAAEKGHKETFSLLMKHGAQVDIKDNNGHTLLHLGVLSGQGDIIKLTINKGVGLNIMNNDGNTPLDVALRHGYKEIVNILITEGAQFSAQNKDGMVPLHIAAAVGNKEIVETLILQGADINAKDKDDFMPLHMAVFNINFENVKLLTEKGTNVNAKTNSDFTPLHLCALQNFHELDSFQSEYLHMQNLASKFVYSKRDSKECSKITEHLLANGADIFAKAIYGLTPLHLAALAGNKEVFEILTKKNANIDCKCDFGWTPLFMAIINKQKELTEALIEKGAEINLRDNDGFTPLNLAVNLNYHEIIPILINKGAIIDSPGTSEILKHPLLSSIVNGYRNIEDELLKDSNKGIYGNNYSTEMHSALFMACVIGDQRLTRMLLEKGANVNATFWNLHSLYIAANFGHNEVIQVLLRYGADANIMNTDGIKPVELAVAENHLKVVETFLQHECVDIDAKGNYGFTLLHIAAQKGLLKMVNYLVDAGANMNATNDMGSKPLHIAAREGHLNVLEFFLNKGMSLNDCGSVNCTLLHYATQGGKGDIVRFLLDQNINIDAENDNGFKPIHSAALSGHADILKLLMEHQAVYNSINIFHQTPLEVATCKEVINILKFTDKLFLAVKQNNLSEVINCIKRGGVVNAKNSENSTVLHYASWKGYKQVVDILLKNKANPNTVGKQGCTPLHYAAKYGHGDIVKSLLSNGAMYNSKTNKHKVPCDFSEDRDIIRLLKTVERCFTNVKNRNLDVISYLENINDLELLKLIIKARDEEYGTLMHAAINNNFPELEKLKVLMQGKVREKIIMANVLLENEMFKEASSLLEEILHVRKELFGEDNPATLDIKQNIAYIMYKQRKYLEALEMIEDIYQKRKEALGSDNKDTLSSQTFVAKILHRQGKYKKALEILQEVYEKQKDKLSLNDEDLLDTQFYLAVVLESLGRYEEALDINYDTLKRKMKKCDKHDPNILSLQNNRAILLSNLGKYDEAIEMYKKVYKLRRKVLGMTNSDTLRVMHNIAAVYLKQKEYDLALKEFEKIYELQRKVLGSNNIDTLNTLTNIGNVLFEMKLCAKALNIYKESLDKRKDILGSNHPDIILTLAKMKTCEIMLQLFPHNA